MSGSARRRRRSLLRIAERLGLADRDGAGLLEIPAGSNGRGLREAGAIPDAGPGYGELEGALGRAAGEIARAAADGELTALYLLQTDPIRDQDDRALWERALHSAALVVAHASVLTEGLQEHATVIFPAESHAEKEGTVVHPDGRLQRLRIAIAHPGEVQPGWAVITELARRAGTDFGVERSADAFEQLVAAVPFYDGLTLDEIGGEGLRWPERDRRLRSGPAREVCRGTPQPPGSARPTEPVASQNGALRLGHLPPDLGGARVRDLAGAAVPDPRPAARAVARRRAPAGHQRRRRGDRDPERNPAAGTRRDPLGGAAGQRVPGDRNQSDSANALTEPLIEVVKA